jgi:hypothetical protein
MTRPCFCDRAACGQPYTPEQCRVCWLYHNDRDYRALWDGETSAPAPRSLPCLYLGDVLDRLDCACPGRWLRGCAVHTVCTIKQCKTCRDYEPNG